MLRLLYVQRGTTGALRRYQHPKLGLIETVTTWRDPGAHIIHIETERDRQKWLAMGDKLCQRYSPLVRTGARVRVMDSYRTMTRTDEWIDRLVEAQLQRWRSAQALRVARSEAWQARYRALRAASEERRRRRKLKCGAHTRRGTSCQRKALANGRCRNHGGLSTGPKTEAGRARIAEAQRRRWAARKGVGASTETCQMISENPET